MTTQVLIDTDPGVDDAMAILMALASPDLEVVGLTTIFGNAATDVTTANAQRLLDVAGRPELPVAQGASRPLASDYLGPVPQVHGHNGLGDAPLAEPSAGPSELGAAELMWELASARPGELTLLALGPLTNLATALQRRPELVDLVAEVVLMGGNALGPGNATPVAEANVNNDPEAADLVLGAGWDVTMVGLDVTQRVNLGGEALDRILAGDSPGARLLARAVPLYRRFFEETNGIDGIYVHDPSAVAYLVDPSAFTTSAWPIRVETESFSRGKTWPNLGNTDEATPRAWRDRPLVDVCVEVDDARVLALVEERLTAGA